MHNLRAFYNSSENFRAYEMDGFYLELDAVDRVYQDSFRPLEILKILDVPGFVIVIVSGENSICGARYEMVLFDLPRKRAGSAYFGHCGVRYEFSFDGGSIVGIEPGSQDPEVLFIENTTIFEPTRLSALSVQSPPPRQISSLPVRPSPVSAPPSHPAKNRKLPAD